MPGSVSMMIFFGWAAMPYDTKWALQLRIDWLIRVALVGKWSVGGGSQWQFFSFLFFILYSLFFILWW